MEAMITRFLSIDSIPRINDEFCLCLGYFDGVHLGHQKLIGECLNEGYKTAVLTLDKSPAFLLGKIDDSAITPLEEKQRIFSNLKVDFLLVLQFDNDLMKLSALDFISLVLKKLNPKKIFVGSDYTFGCKGIGNVDMLSQYFDLKVVDFYYVNELKVSSRDIRKDILNGDVKRTADLLNRSYKISGNVIMGNQIGRTIGFPTANLQLAEKYIYPKIGVYMGYASIANELYKCIISIGVHPTIKELDKPLIEVHIIDSNDNLYSKTIDVYFVDFIRDIKKFDSLKELKAQLEKDKELTKNALQSINMDSIIFKATKF